MQVLLKVKFGFVVTVCVVANKLFTLQFFLRIATKIIVNTNESVWGFNKVTSTQEGVSVEAKRDIYEYAVQYIQISYVLLRDTNTRARIKLHMQSEQFESSIQ